MFAVKQCSCANGSGAVGADCPGHGVPHCVRCSPGYLLRAPDRGACDPIGRLSFDYRDVLERLRSDSVDGMDLLSTTRADVEERKPPGTKSTMTTLDSRNSRKKKTGEDPTHCGGGGLAAYGATLAWSASFFQPKAPSSLTFVFSTRCALISQGRQLAVYLHALGRQRIAWRSGFRAPYEP